MINSQTFAGQRICVIGGTAGMGAAIARQAAEAGAEVIAAGSRHLDIGSEESIRAFFAALGPIDHLVVSAAFVRRGPFRSLDAADARLAMDGKFWSQYFCARHAQVSRSITLFSGTLSRKPAKGLSIISAINGAVESLGRALAVELAPIRVNVISPGLIQGTNAFVQMPEEARQGMYAGAAARLPAGLVGDADSVAGPTLALMASPYATGTVLDIDGGGLVG